MIYFKITRDRKERSHALLKRFENRQIENILYTDEAIFTTEETYNPQNSRVYVPSRVHLKNGLGRVARATHPKQ